MSDSVIDRIYQEHNKLREYLSAVKEPSFLADADTQFRKVLLLAAASYFEGRLRSSLIDYFTEKAQNDQQTMAFLKAKGIERQYHTYFKWDGANANQFFGLFGTGYKDFMVQRIRNDATLGDAVKAFIELGALRNDLVHRDFATFPLEKTVDEIYALYERALLFVDSVGPTLREAAGA
jgi:hypothetical protein